MDSGQECSAFQFKYQNFGIQTPQGWDRKGLDSGKNTKTLRDLNRGNLFHEISFGKLGTKDQGGCRGSAKNWVNWEVKKGKGSMFYETKENCGVMDNNRNKYKKQLKGLRSWGSQGEFPKEILDGYYGKPKYGAKNVLVANGHPKNLSQAPPSGGKNPNKSTNV